MLDWTWFTVSGVASVFWLAILRRGLRRMTADECPPQASRSLTFATITVVSLMLLATSLIYADLMTIDTGRWFLNTARVAMLVGGASVWWTGRTGRMA